MTARITQQQLESYLWGAATLLRGTIDAGDYKQFIFPMLFFTLEEIRRKQGNLSIPLCLVSVNSKSNDVMKSREAKNLAEL